jgi:hypothetical protein
MTDSTTMIQPIIVQQKSQEIQFAERRLAAQLARIEAQASSDRLARGSDQGEAQSWWRYY